MTTATATRTFQIDKTHSEAAFQVRHLISKVRGRFTDFDGAIAFDEAEPQRSTVNLTIQAASIDTGVADRDAHLRSTDFFAVDQYPTITFRSTAIAPKGNDEFEVTGDLTMRGVTRQVVIPVSYLGAAVDPWGNQKIAFEGEVTLNRKDYGLTWNAALETGGFLVGDDVKVSLSVQAAGK
ncbi:MAG TPA: YceI family protein [Vicinamibacterales bacterium]|nr:YceI family protein [Vicinamibacterales bacterium]